MPKRWLDGQPVADPDLGTLLVGTIPAGTTLTPVFSVAINVGDLIYWRAALSVVHVGSTAFTVTPGYTGTAANINWIAKRFTAAAVAVTQQTTFTATASNLAIVTHMEGSFSATTAGNFTIGATRTGGTSSIVQIGSALIVVTR